MNREETTMTMMRTMARARLYLLSGGCPKGLVGGGVVGWVGGKGGKGEREKVERISGDDSKPQV